MPQFLPHLPTGGREVLLPQVSAQHRCRCSTSSLAAGPPRLRMDRAADELQLFHPLRFPSSLMPSSSVSWGGGGQQYPPFLPFSLPPTPAGARHRGAGRGCEHGGCAGRMPLLRCPPLLSSPRLPQPPWWDGCRRPLHVARALVGGEHARGWGSAGSPSRLRCITGGPLSQEPPHEQPGSSRAVAPEELWALKLSCPGRRGAVGSAPSRVSITGCPCAEP